MFKVDLGIPFKATAEIPSPDGDLYPLECHFKWLGRDEFIAWCKDTAAKSDPEFFAPLIESWDADVPCDAEGMKTLFNRWPKAGRALFETYQRVLLGLEEKN